MIWQLLKLEPTRASYAAKTCVAVIAGYALALAFEWKASSIATTIIVLQSASLGSSLKKAAERVLGTLIGAFVGLLLAAAFSYEKEVFIVCMAGVTWITVWGMQSSNNTYAWQLALLTTAVVGWPAASDALTVFPASIDRVVAVVVGVLLFSIVHAVFWPVTAKGQFEQLVTSLLTGCRDLISDAHQQILVSNTLDEKASTNGEKLFTQLSKLPSTMKAARVDSQRMRHYNNQYARLEDELQELVVESCTLSDAIRFSSRDQDGPVPLRSNEVLNSLDNTECALGKTADQWQLPRDGKHAPGSANSKAPHSADRDTNQIESSSQVSSSQQFLIERADRLREVATRIQGTIATLEDPAHQQKHPEPLPKPTPATWPRVMKATLAATQVLLSAWFIILIAWPLGFQVAMLLIMIFAFTNASMPISLVSRSILSGVGMALPVAALFYFGVMPRLDGFAELAPWLAMFFFPFLYLTTSQHPQTSLTAMLVILLSNSLISISATPPTYGFSSFMNLYIGMGGGFCVVLFLAYLFESRNPRQGLHKILSGLLLQAGKHLGDRLNPDLSDSDADSNANEFRRSQLQLIGKAHKLSLLLESGKDPHLHGGEFREILRAVEVLTLRVISRDSMNAIRLKSELNQSPALTWCEESLQEIGRDLQAFRPIQRRDTYSTHVSEFDPGTHAVKTEGDTLPSQPTQSRDSLMGVQSRSLVESVVEIYSRLEPVDWKGWCSNRF